MKRMDYLEHLDELHHIRVNVPETREKYESGNGEGMWVVVDAATKDAHDAHIEGGIYEGVLDNDSWYWHGLDHGTVINFEMRGEHRPVVPFEWLVSHYMTNEEYYGTTDEEPDLPIYCPLCGNNSPYIEYYDGSGWGVYCSFCGCNIHGYKTREGAISQWNHRYNEAAQDGNQ